MQESASDVSVRPHRKDSNNMVATEGEEDSSRRQCRWSPCFLWMSFCGWYRRLLERIFVFLGQIIASHPCVTICLSLLVVGVCSIGFLRWKVENRTEKLFVPQDSEAMADLYKADEYFRMNVRQETVLLEALAGNVLEPKCLKEMLEIHQEILKLDSYVDLCSTSSGEKANSSQTCLFINPLEIFNFSDKNVANITQQIYNAHNDPAQLMRNGRPLVYNFPRLFGGITKSRSGEMIAARAVQMIYYMQDGSERVLEWEERFLKKMASMKPRNATCGRIHYSAESGMDGVISESIKSGILYVYVGFALMITCACAMLAKTDNPLTGHSLLACAGVLAVSLGNLAGFGLASFLGTPFIHMAGIVPLLVLSIGIDDMLIIVHKLDRHKPRDVESTIKVALCHSGVFITMTTLTDVVAFAVSITSSFPAIRYFCVYAACSATLAYLMMMTFFIAFVVFDVRRIKIGCRDCLPCCRAPRPGDGVLAWDEPRPQTSNKMMAAWGKFLVFRGTKIAVIFLSLGFLGAGIYGASKIDTSFGRRLLARKDSYFTKFLEAQDRYFSPSIEVSIVLSEQFDYGQKDHQMEIRKLSNVVLNNEHYENHTVSWLDIFLRYAEKRSLNITSSKNFTSELKTFMEIPSFSLFKQDVKLSTDEQHIAASRILAFMNPSNSSTIKRDAMISLREDLASESELSVFPISRRFIFYEQYVAIPRETLRNLLIAATSILVVTVPYLVSVSVALFVCLGFVAFTFELLGLMYIWGVSLNALSMTNLVMAIAFSVDYNAHIAHAFVTSQHRTGNERVVNALETMGSSVFKGGMCTLLGILVTALATLEIYNILFKMFFGIVIFGLLHGLCFLPVYLSIICWQPAVIIETIPTNTYSRLDGTSPETVPMWERGIVIESDYDE